MTDATQSEGLLPVEQGQAAKPKTFRATTPIDLMAKVFKHHGWPVELGRMAARFNEFYEMTADARNNRYVASPRTPSRDHLATTDAVREAVKPWADYHGDLPDYDHPLRPVFESGVQYTVELLAKELGVPDWTPCDGTEEFDGDLGGTLMNIVLAAMPVDEHGDPMHPKEVREALATPSAPRPDAGPRDQARTIEVLRRALVWHGDPARMATTREDWQQEVDAAVRFVRDHPEEGFPARPSIASEALAALRSPAAGVEREHGVQITARQRSAVVADYGDNYLVARVSADGTQVGIDHPCDAVWAEVMVAHVALRDYINERIDRQEACPFKPATLAQPAPAVEEVERLREVVQQFVAWLDRADDPADDCCYLNEDGWDDVREIGQSARAALSPESRS